MIYSAEQLVQKLSKLKLTLGSCESFTGGLFASVITDVPGASQVFTGALITYATRLKTELLKMDDQLIQQVGVVSDTVAIYMACNGLAILNTDICVSFTGNAGPTASKGTEVGEFYIGIAIKDKTTHIHKIVKNLSREELKKYAVDIALKEILIKIDEYLA